jgi:hypothetical protein
VLHARGSRRCWRRSRDAAIHAKSFAGIVEASRGAHCRPLHPRLAFSVTRLRETIFVYIGRGILSPYEAKEFHLNVVPRQSRYELAGSSSALALREL